MEGRFAVAALVLAVGSASTAAAQAPRVERWPRPIDARFGVLGSPLSVTPHMAATSLLGSARTWIGADSTAIRKTHWKTGALIGGGVLGVMTAVFAVGMCSFDGPCGNPVLPAVGGFAIGGVTGFGIGALVGGQFPVRAP